LLGIILWLGESDADAGGDAEIAAVER